MPQPANSSGDNPALSARKQQQARGCSGSLGWVIVAMLLVGGCVMFYILMLRPCLGMLQAQGWIATPCTVVSSDVKANRNSLQLIVVFKYDFNQKAFQSDKYCFSSMSSNTANDWKRKVVNDHPAGKQTTCFVNPHDPAEAVIERGWVPDMWWGLFPIPFLLMGGTALLAGLGVIRVPGTNTLRRPISWKPLNRTSPATSKPDESDSDAEASDLFENSGVSDGPVTLQSSSTPLGGFLVVLSIALFWNGIVSVFVWQAYQEFQRGGIAGLGWFPVVFLIPFVLIGLGLVVGVFYSLLNLFNPRPTLTVNSQSIPLGAELRLSWTVSSRVNSINRLKISLKGIEKATYRRGTSNYTDEATFADIPLVETFEPFEIAEGGATVTIPADTMHSFAASNNKIEWSLIVQGDIQLWPDMTATFPITVLPKLAKESA